MAQDFSIIVVRHAEKAPAESDPELSSKGLQRAQILAEMLSRMQLEAIYSTPFQRTEQTVRPTANRFNLSINSYKAGDGEPLMSKLRTVAQNALVVGHSNTVPGMIRALGLEADNMTEQDYGDLFLIHFHDDQPHLVRFMIPMPE